VAAAPADRFQAEDLTRLCAYVRAATLERHAAEDCLRIGPRSRAPSNNRRSTKSGAASLSHYATMDLQGGADAGGSIAKPKG
jgi:hypothetical protein